MSGRGQARPARDGHRADHDVGKQTSVMFRSRSSRLVLVYTHGYNQSSQKAVRPWESQASTTVWLGDDDGWHHIVRALGTCLCMMEDYM